MWVFGMKCYLPKIYVVSILRFWGMTYWQIVYLSEIDLFSIFSCISFSSLFILVRRLWLSIMLLSRKKLELFGEIQISSLLSSSFLSSLDSVVILHLPLSNFSLLSILSLSGPTSHWELTHQSHFLFTRQGSSKHIFAAP